MLTWDIDEYIEVDMSDRCLVGEFQVKSLGREDIVRLSEVCGKLPGKVCENIRRVCGYCLDDGCFSGTVVSYSVWSMD